MHGLASIQRDREAGPRRRPGHRCRPGARGQGPPSWSAATVVPDEARHGARRHRGRPGRLLRGLATDHPRRPDLEAHDSIFYCVANMPGAVPNTSTYALTNVTLPYTVALANAGWQRRLPPRPGACPGPEHPRRSGRLRPGRRGPRHGADRRSTRCWRSRVPADGPSRRDRVALVGAVRGYLDHLSGRAWPRRRTRCSPTAVT